MPGVDNLSNRYTTRCATLFLVPEGFDIGPLYAMGGVPATCKGYLVGGGIAGAGRASTVPEGEIILQLAGSARGHLGGNGSLHQMLLDAVYTALCRVRGL